MTQTVMLTTFDNPYDPFTQFDRWYQFDIDKGYNTCAYLDRIALVSDEFSEEEYNQAISRAVDEVIRYDFLNMYKKVTR